MRKSALLCGVALLGFATLGLPATANAAGKKATVTVVNHSDWEIHHFFLSPTEQDKWGPDQLGDDVIGTDEKFSLNQIPCDTYDVKLVDEDGDECVVEEVDICGGAAKWTITNDALLGCQEETGDDDDE
jgi:hypothetical protein